MSYHTETEVSIKVELKRRTQKDDFEEIAHAAITDAFSKDFSELEIDLEVGDDFGSIEMEIYDTSSYRKSDHYEVASKLMKTIHDSGFKVAAMNHSTGLVEQEDEDEESEGEE